MYSYYPGEKVKLCRGAVFISCPFTGHLPYVTVLGQLTNSSCTHRGYLLKNYRSNLPKRRVDPNECKGVWLAREGTLNSRPAIIRRKMEAVNDGTNGAEPTMAH